MSLSNPEGAHDWQKYITAVQLGEPTNDFNWDGLQEYVCFVIEAGMTQSQLHYQSTLQHRLYLAKAENLEHTAQPKGSSTGWRVSFLGGSVNLILFQESSLLPAFFFFLGCLAILYFSGSWAGFSLLALPESNYLYCLQLGRKDRGMEGGREGANEQSFISWSSFVYFLLKKLPYRMECFNLGWNCYRTILWLQLGQNSTI